MSLLPLLLNLDRPTRLNNQQFALALTPEDILTLAAAPSVTDYRRPWQQVSAFLKDAGSTIKTNKNKFQVNLDVQHFSPDEISVSVCNGYIVIEGKHDEKQDQHGFVSRHFTRRYKLPDSCDIDAIQSQLSSDGVLTVSAPLQRLQPSERSIPIVQTGPVNTQPSEVKNEVGNGEPSDINLANNK